MGSVDNMIRQATSGLEEKITALGTQVARLEERVATSDGGSEDRLARTMAAALAGMHETLFIQISDRFEPRVRTLEEAIDQPQQLAALRVELAAAKWEATHWKHEARRLAQQVKDAVGPLVEGEPT